MAYKLSNAWVKKNCKKSILTRKEMATAYMKTYKAKQCLRYNIICKNSEWALKSVLNLPHLRKTRSKVNPRQERNNKEQKSKKFNKGEK